MNQENDNLIRSSGSKKSGMGAVSWAVIEMFRQAGMPELEMNSIQQQMDVYFPKPSNQTCNSILKIVESRLETDKVSEDTWYN